MSELPVMTIQLARDIAQDTANRQMQDNGRTEWITADYALACDTFYDLWPMEDL